MVQEVALKNNIEADPKKYLEKTSEVLSEVSKVIVGQEYMINRLLIGLFTNGHILLEGVPGLAKTLTIKTLSKILNLNFRRIQFTPDLLPADLLGTMIYNQQKSVFEVKKGPIFSNIILADEINRSPAKVQSALLESMQEHQVTIGETTFLLDEPFLVLATQNPIDQEGTYPLPEAQTDRFMMKVHVNFPDKASELEVMRRMSDMNHRSEVNCMMSKEDIFAVRECINRVKISESLERYIVELVFATRFPKDYGLKEESEYIQFGVSPRAAISLNLAAKAIAFFNSRDFVMPEDIKDAANDVFNHRIILTYEAQADGVTTSAVIQTILRKVEIAV